MMSGLGELRTPVGLRKIGPEAFCCCGKLRSVVLNEGLQTVSECAFEMSGVEGVRVPASVRELCRSAFKLCESLRSVSLQEGLETICETCFYFVGLREVLVPTSVRKIGAQAFSGCKELAVFRLARGSRLAVVGYCALAGTCVERDSVGLPPETRVSPDAFENSRRW